MELDGATFSFMIGTICGIISGFGIGGGSLLMVWMTAVVMIEQRSAQAINLLYFIPTSAGALFSHIRNKMIAWPIVLPATIGGCVSAALGSTLGSVISVTILRKLFGAFLLIVGIKEILMHKKAKEKM